MIIYLYIFKILIITLQYLCTTTTPEKIGMLCKTWICKKKLKVHNTKYE